MNRVFIIAEAGVNHNGSVKIAKKLIDTAVEAECDAVKFQTFKAENIVTKTALKARYQIRNSVSHESQFEMLKKLELPFSDFKKLFFYCKKKNIIFMSTPYDEESVDFLDRLGIKIFKIPSGEITNKPLIRHVATKRKPIILSTGMSYLEEVEKSIKWINEVWEKLNKKPHLSLLHCVSDYPAKMDDINLFAMKTLESTFGLPVGFSDHTVGIEIPIAAVALGAKVIEKHFTLDKHMDGPDHRASLEPDELRAMVRAIRNVEKAMGDGVKKPSLSELKNKPIVRKSIVTARDIRKGETFTEEKITVKRPGTGISPMKWHNVIGKKAKRDFGKDEVVEL